jgi:hypothetical protein
MAGEAPPMPGPTAPAASSVACHAAAAGAHLQQGPNHPCTCGSKCTMLRSEKRALQTELLILPCLPEPATGSTSPSVCPLQHALPHTASRWHTWLHNPHALPQTHTSRGTRQQRQQQQGWQQQRAVALPQTSRLPTRSCLCKTCRTPPRHRCLACCLRSSQATRR